MRKVTVLLFLTLAITLSAIVNLGDEYIGTAPMGQFRKTYNFTGVSSAWYDDRAYTDYYYDEAISTRLTLIESCYANLDCTTYSKQIYEYQDYDDHYVKIESFYYKDWEHCWEEDGYELESVTTSTYDLQDKPLESQTVYFNDGVEGTIRRTVYGYDDNGNMILKNIYNNWPNETEPREANSYAYDSQNRMIHTQKTINGNVTYEVWKTWSNHTLPDSIYVRNGFYITIQQNFFDENEVRNLSRVWQNKSEGQWERTDTYYQYISAHQMHFPLMHSSYIGLVNGLDGPFEPETTYTKNYFYTDDYHKATVSRFYDYSDVVYTNDYSYDDNWLLTEMSVRNVEWFSTEVSTWRNTWEYYGPTSSDDPTEVPPAVVFTYPNPAKGMVNISLSKRDAAPAKAKVYNIKGQLVRSLAVSDLSGDKYLYNWDCKDESKRAVPAGVYLIRIKTTSGEVNKKVTVIR